MGERPIEGEDLINSIYRYELITPFCKGKRVLDYGCGFGFGTMTLHNRGIYVEGMEPDLSVVNEASRRFPYANFKQDILNNGQLNNFDIVACMEVIEHLDDASAFLKRLVRWIPEFIGSTPNGDKFPMLTPYHKKHYKNVELVALFKEYYSEVKIFGACFDPNPNVSFYCTHMIWARR